jgi:hypothetical protein
MCRAWNAVLPLVLVGRLYPYRLTGSGDEGELDGIECAADQQYSLGTRTELGTQPSVTPAPFLCEAIKGFFARNAERRAAPTAPASGAPWHGGFCALAPFWRFELVSELPGSELNSVQ